MTRELDLLTDGARMLAEARGLFEVRDVRSVAIAAVAYAKAKDLGEDAVRSASRIVILSTVRLGEELIEGRERREIATQTTGGNRSLPDGEAPPATLDDLGITYDLSAIAQRLARQPEAVNAYIADAPLPTLAGAERAARDAAGVQWETAIMGMVSPETLRASSVDRFQAALQGAIAALEAIDPPLSGGEAEPFLITAGAIVRKLGRSRGKLEAVR
ncbi:MAG: hypothetical protein ABIZ34_05590 [Candidatus Limnocylindrales bacterium]